MTTFGWSFCVLKDGCAGKKVDGCECVCMVQTTVYLKSSVSYVRTYYLCTILTRQIEQLSTASHSAKHKSHYQIFVLRSANVFRLIV